MKRCGNGISNCGQSWVFRFASKIRRVSPSEPSLGYGLLYNWYAATDARGIAPSGFRVPSNSDFQILQTTLGGDSTAGGALKSTRLLADGQPYWDAPNTGATNSSGMSLFPAGIRQVAGTYIQLNTTCQLGTTEANVTWYSIQSNTASMSNSGFFDTNTGRSITCVSDTVPSSATVTDADGNEYTWVQIGSQYWLKQSLKTTKYNNGDDIPTGLDNTQWANTTSGAWAYPNGDSTLPI